MHNNRKLTIIKVSGIFLSIILMACSTCGCGSTSRKSSEESTVSSGSRPEDGTDAAESSSLTDDESGSSEQSRIYESENQKSNKSGSTSSSSKDAIRIDLNSGCEALTEEETEDLVYTIYDDYFADAQNDPERIKETTYSSYITQYDEPGDQFAYGTISYKRYKMRYGIQIIGEPDEDGTYPLYIALHGGGEADSETNDEQWEDMFYYYCDSVTDGIYVNVRGITDTWNLHFMDESYYMYDRLIEDMILFENADANRVYLLGFSAGGDGVYQVSARMADRFAAANMSSGHPNGVSFTNLMNLPILLQAGIRDNMVDRNTVTVESGMQLDRLSEQYHYGYEHDVFIHVPEGHNYADNDADEDSLQQVIENPCEFLDRMADDSNLREVVNEPDYAYAIDEDVDDLVYEAVDAADLKTCLVDSNAVRWVSQYSRDPYPSKLVWDLDTRAADRDVESFYYLKAPAETKGVLSASYDRNQNSITVDASGAKGDFTILFNPFMLDLSKPIALHVDEMTFSVNAAPSEELIRESIEETSDLYRVYAAEISYKELLSYQE